MTGFAHAIAADLRARAGFLLEAGRDDAGSHVFADFVPAPLTTIAGAREAAQSLNSLMPALLRESVERSLSDDRFRRSNAPHRAQLPTAPWAWQRDQDDVWSPRHWLEPEEVEKASANALRWLLYLIIQIDSRLTDLHCRAGDQLEEVASARVDATSAWSHDEIDRMRLLVAELEGAREQLDRARKAVSTQVGRALPPSERRPRPYPSGRAWQTLARLARLWLDPTATARPHLERLLNTPFAFADLPYLYERWCGVHVLDSFATAGWKPRNDEKALWTIFLGGRIELRDEQDAPGIDIWVEPRITRSGHACGLVSVDRDEQSPDLVVNVHVRDGVESVVLDPTLGMSIDHLETKARYATSLRRTEAQTIAGIRAVKSPRRSWALAPLSDASCRLLGGARETAGVVPMRPDAFDPRPLAAFVADLLDWTRA